MIASDNFIDIIYCICIPNKTITRVCYTGQTNCTWDIEDGWYGGTYIKEFPEDNKDACAQSCCANTQCVTWTWVSSINYCILKKGDHLYLNPTKGQFTAKKNQGELCENKILP